MITLTLTDREFEWLRWQLLRDRPWQGRDDDYELVVGVKAKLLRATGTVPLKPQACKVWDAIKAVSNG